MNRHAKRLAILIGWGFILLGVVGLFLPVLQGVLFILVGLIILSSEYVWAHQVLTRLRERFPKVSHAAEEAAHKAGAWLRRFSGRRESDDIRR